MSLAARLCLVSLASSLLVPLVASAALIAEQPDNTSVHTFSVTNQIRVHAPTFVASGTHQLGLFVNLASGGGTDTCSAAAAGQLRFSATIPSGRNLTATIFHDSATPTPHGTNYVSWGDLSTCTSFIPGNGVMTDYVMPVTLPVLGNTISDSGILDGQSYHVVFGEQAGFPMDVEFKTDASNNVSFHLYDDATTTATTTPAKPDPVIIIPGILGSQEHNGVWVIDPILHSYDDLIATLDANGYTPGIDLFTFPYDWRKSNIDTAVLLKQKIDAVKSLCQCDKVDLVAHSMGGLVARQYIQSPAYQHDVDQLIFLGTPHLGAPKAYLMWEGGEFGTGLDVQAFFVEIALAQEAHERGYSDLFEYVHSEPIDAVQQLLPIYGYLFDGIDLRLYPNGYPTNLFLSTLHNNLNSLASTGVRLMNIVGDLGANSTISAFDVTSSPIVPKWPDGYPIGFADLSGSHGLQMGSGDGTVPFASAVSVRPADATFNVCHASLPSFAKFKIIEGLTGILSDAQTPGVDVCNAEVAIFQILSPADIMIISPDGKRIGKDFETNEEVNEIPGAFYSGFSTNAEYVTVLNPRLGQYRFLTQGTADGGEYTVEVNYYRIAATSSKMGFTGLTTPGRIIDHGVDLGIDGVSISPVDQTAPSIVFLSPATSTYVRSSSLPINIQINDDTGVATSSIQFDNQIIAASTTIDLFFQTLGSHTIKVTAEDYARNSTSSQKSIEVIATLESSKADIIRIFSLGWAKKELKDLIVLQLNQALILKKVTLVAKNGSKTTTIVQVLDKVLMQLIQKELQAANRTGAINSQGYEILSKDIAWIISHN
jgi:pimeloyl-ACP methyl ester carboxylesterase